MTPTLPLISAGLTPTQLRKRVIAQLALLTVGNGTPPAKAVSKP
jgi:hypothetical protein